MPEGATVSFANETDPRTTVDVNMEGDYVLSLSANNSAPVTDTETVNLVVFSADGTPSPYTPWNRPTSTHILFYNQEPMHADRAASGALDTHIVEHFRFDETSGSIASGENGANFNIGSSTWSPDSGIHGGALDVATGEYNLGTYANLANEFSLAFWCKSSRKDGLGQFFKAEGTNEVNYWYMHMHPDPYGLPEGFTCLHFPKPSRRQLMWVYFDLISDWNHVVIAYSPLGDIRKVYINGILEAVQKFNPLDSEASGDPHLIFSESGNGAFLGLIDDLVIYDCMLNNDEVEAIYTAASSADAITNRLPQDPYTTYSYSTKFAAENFPEFTYTYHTNGFQESRFGDGTMPAPYIHPRVWIEREDLDAVRAAYRHTKDGNYIYSELLQYTDAERNRDWTTYVTVQGEAGEYLPTFSISEDSDANGVPYFGRDNVHTASICAEAWLALLHADSNRAKQVINWMMSTAKLQRTILDAANQVSAHWREPYFHDIVIRRGTAFCYDLMYPWMTEYQRETIRGIIADATKGKTNIGMHGIAGPGSNRSNWQNWITGELAMNLAAIFQENGFDQEAYDAATLATQRTIEGTMGKDGVTFEGMSKLNITSANYAMLSRDDPTGQKLMSADHLYNHVAKFRFHMLEPWATSIYYDEKLGGLVNNMKPQVIRAIHYAYPNDPIINFMKHLITSGKDYGRLTMSTFGQDSHLMTSHMIQDWTGDEDLVTHMANATKAANEPLGFFSNFRGMIEGKSAWNADALQLIHLARVIEGQWHSDKEMNTT